MRQGYLLETTIRKSRTLCQLSQL